MRYVRSSCLAVSLSCTVALAYGCAYTPPQTNNSSQTGGSGGSAGAGGMAEGGQGGMPGAGGSGGSGGSEACTVNGSEQCYSGPPGVAGVGKCSYGTRKCSGGTWSACEGFVWPTPEPCNSGDDTNCDEIVGCSGHPLRAISNGSNGDDAVLSMANGPGINGSDGIVVATGIKGAATWTADAPISGNVLAMIRNPAGNLQDFSSQFVVGAESYAFGAAAAITDSGSSYIFGGVYVGSLSVAGSPLEDAVVKRAFIAKFLPTGALEFAKSITSGGPVELRSVVLSPAGQIFVSGNYIGAPSVGGQTLPTAATPNGFVASFSAAGEISWVMNVTGQFEKDVKSLAFGNDRLFAAVRFAGPLALSNEQAGSDLSMSNDGGSDIAVIEIGTTSGLPLSAQKIGGSGDVYLGGLTAAQDKVVVVGGYRGAWAAGGLSGMSNDGLGEFDAFVTRYSMNGTLEDAYLMPANGNQKPEAVAMDSFGNIVVTGTFTGDLAPGNGVPTIQINTSDENAFVLKFDAKLSPLWAKSFGDASYAQRSRTVTIGKSTGHVFFGGGHQGTLSGFPNAPSSTGGFDAFIGALAN